MSSAGWLNAAWRLTCRPEARRFNAATCRVAETQADLLAGMIRASAGTEFGGRHGFESIRTARDYQERVPLSTYGDYANAIDRIARGERNVLTAEPVLLLEPTSGTTSGEKLIPFTASLRRQFQRGIATWIADLFGQRPKAANGRAYWSISPAISKPKRAPGGPPIGFDDDAAYLGGWQQLLIRRLLAVPPNVARIRDSNVFHNKTLLYLLAARDLSLISVWSPTFLPALLAPLSDWHEKLSGDLQAMNRLRADEVRSIFRSTTELAEIHRQLWPNLALISVWADAAAQWFVPDLQRLFPAVELQPKGLLATEGCVTIPLIGEAAPALAVRSHFFEFQRCNLAGAIDGDECLLAHELAVGANYRIVITTGGGLYRYQLGDLVEVAGFLNEAPLLRFLGKGDQVCDLVGEKLAEPFVQSLLTGLFHELRLQPRFFLLAPALDQPPRYRLFIQPTTPVSQQTSDALAALLDQRLRSNPHYGHAVELGQLAPVEVDWLRAEGPAAAELFQQARIEQGHKAGAIKAVALDPWPEWSAVFHPLAAPIEEMSS